jgi:Uma2 family endonuclease
LRAKVPSNSIEVPNPVRVDAVAVDAPHRCKAKLAGYFKPPSVAHYLIIDPDKTLIVHHARGTGDTILTRVVQARSVTLDPPGLELTVGDVYGES